MHKKLFAVLAVLAVAAVAYASSSQAVVTVNNDYLWYNASEILTFTVDGVPYTADASGVVDFGELGSGSHSVSVTFQAGQEYNYCFVSDSCSGSHNGAFSCEVTVLDRLSGGCS